MSRRADEIARRTWEDVRDGETLPEVRMEVTLRRCVLDAAATRDYFPGHHDRDYARYQNVRDVYLNTMFFHGFVDRVGGEWAGPAAWLARRRLEMVAPVCVGDTMRTEGRVLRRYEEDGRALVDVEIRVFTEKGLSTKAVLTYALPRADGAPIRFD
jgi:acyl dehydratase